MWSILYREDGTEDHARGLDGRQLVEVVLDDRSSSCGTVEQYDARLAGCGDHGEPVATITCDEELPDPGWEDRAVERARREGVIR
jgi:hypothetical protein